MWQAHREGGRQWLEGCRGRELGEREPSVKVNKKHTQTDEKLCRALKRDSGGGKVGEKGIRGARRGEGEGKQNCLLLAVSGKRCDERTNGARTEARQAKRATLIRHVVRGLSRQHAQCNGIFMLHHVAVISHV